MSEETVTWNLELQVSELTMSELRKVEMIAYRSIALLRRLGLPEEVDAAVAKLQRLVMVIRLTHTALVALQTAMIPGAGPFALAMAGLTAGTMAFAATDFMISMGE